MDNNGILCVIPARGGSRGLKDKNILSLCGKPTVMWTVEQAQKELGKENVYVSTESSHITSILKDWDVPIIKRPKSLATDESPIEDTLRHAYFHFAKRQKGPKIIVWLQADCPVRFPGRITQVLQKLQEESYYTAVATVKKVKERPEWMKRVVNGGNPTLSSGVFYGNRVPYRRQDLSDLYLLDGSATAMRVPELLYHTEGGLHKFLGDRVGYIEQTFPYTLDIDNIWDFRLAETVLKEIGENEVRNSGGLT